MRWCKERFHQLDLSLNTKSKTPKSISILDNKGTWSHSEVNSKVDSTFMEKWMGRNCLIVIEQFIDEKYFKYFNYPPVEHSFKAQFKKHGTVTFEWNDDGLFRQVDADNKVQLFYSKSLLANIKKLY